MRGSLRWLLGVMLGCSAPDDGALYRQAAALPPAQAAASCDRISDAALQGECLSFAATAAVDQGETALAATVCAQASAAFWREECAFMIADRRGRRRAAAVRDCAPAGRFEDDCLSHALERDLESLPAATRGPGGEQALYAELLDMATHYAADEATANAELLLAHIIARRIGPGPLRLQACGQSPESACHKGFLIALSIPGPGVDRGAACRSARTAEAVAAAGLRPWDPDAEPQGRAALTALCDAMARGKDPGHLGELLEETPSLPMGTHFMLPPPWLRGITMVPWDDGI